MRVGVLCEGEAHGVFHEAFHMCGACVAVINGLSICVGKCG